MRLSVKALVSSVSSSATFALASSFSIAVAWSGSLALIRFLVPSASRTHLSAVQRFLCSSQWTEPRPRADLGPCLPRVLRLPATPDDGAQQPQFVLSVDDDCRVSGGEWVEDHLPPVELPAFDDELLAAFPPSDDDFARLRCAVAVNRDVIAVSEVLW